MAFLISRRFSSMIASRAGSFSLASVHFLQNFGLSEAAGRALSHQAGGVEAACFSNSDADSLSSGAQKSSRSHTVPTRTPAQATNLLGRLRASHILTEFGQSNARLARDVELNQATQPPFRMCVRWRRVLRRRFSTTTAMRRFRICRASRTTSRPPRRFCLPMRLRRWGLRSGPLQPGRGRPLRLWQR